MQQETGMIDIDKLEELLINVQKPARYTGGELGEVKKPIDSNTVRFAFCFPDVYEVGMSHMGTSILYHLANSMDGVYAERCFFAMAGHGRSHERGGYTALFARNKDTALRF